VRPGAAAAAPTPALVASPSVSLAARAVRLVLRAASEVYGFAAAALGGVLCAAAFFSPGEERPWLQVAALCTLAAILVRKLAVRLALRGGPPWLRRLFEGRRERRVRRLDLELGLLCVSVAFALVELAGGGASPFYPVVLLLCAFLVTFNSAAVGVAVAGWAVALEAGAAALGTTAWDGALVRAGFLVAFAAAHAAFLRGEVTRLRLGHARELKTALRRAEDEAREYRLLVAGRGDTDERGPSGERARTRADEEQLLYRAAVEDIRASMFYTLELTKRALSLHTCAVLWLTEDGAWMEIKECATDSGAIREGAVPAGEGAPGGVIKRAAPVRMADLKPGYAGLSYYEGGADAGAKVRHFCAVPVTEGPHLRGVLCADRADGTGGGGAPAPFSEREEEALAAAAEQLVRAVHNERIFVDVEKTKYEQTNFFAASKLLLSARTADEAYARAFEACRRIAHHDLAAVALFDRERKRHLIARVAGDAPDAGELEGLEFADNTGLAAMAVKNRHYLPITGELRDKDQTIFTRKTRLRGYESLVILPLIRPVRPKAPGTSDPTHGGGWSGGGAGAGVGAGAGSGHGASAAPSADPSGPLTISPPPLPLPSPPPGPAPVGPALEQAEAIGSLVLAARGRGAFPKAKREMLQVIANQAAAAIENARMYDEMERRATVDGLTGLTNHRHFQERLDEMLARAVRHRAPVALVLCDIDHFKNVNDTYGHPVGDQVLKRVAAILEQQGRKTDIVARYGGEEFVLALEGGDAEGARQVAERVREQVKRALMPAEKGSFRVTMSFGIAAFPEDAPDKAALIERADQALYAAKHGGRDRAELWCKLPALARRAAAGADAGVGAGAAVRRPSPRAP
jgi:diguanylate cyclase (GGDEF)-like protein